MPVEVLRCPNCGAPLESINDITRCSYCNNVVYIHLDREGLLARLAPSAVAPGDPANDSSTSNTLEAQSLPPGEFFTSPVSPEEAAHMAADICELMQNGSRIPAIRLYRGRTGAALLDAKKAVEALKLNPTDAAVLEKLRQGEVMPELEPTQYQELANQVRALLQNGQKNEAIKFYRQHTDCSLQEANYSVDAIEAGKLVDMQSSEIPAPESGLPVDQIRHLILDGKSEEAVQIYKQNTGVSHAEAQAAVFGIRKTLTSESLDREASYQQRSRLMVTVFVIALVIMLAGIVAFILMVR